MITTGLIQQHHLTRKAIIYIRQSSPHQVLSNQESLRLQYALNQRAQQLGWTPEQIRVIDADLGITGASTHQREGYKEVLDLVTRGQVGILLSYEVQRLSRNCTDWYPLLDICAYKSCLIGDNDGIYDPASTNGRLLLGLKGQLSELELHTIRSRMTAGLLNKAHRGELALRLPVGLTRTPQGQVIKTPHQEVQGRIELVFQLFEQSRTANQVLRHLNQEQLLLPRQNRFGDLIWKKPTIAMVLQFLKNPAYAGVFVYGKTRTQRDPLSGQVSVQRLPIEEWKICVRDKYPAYITWGGLPDKC
jgi:DNA invertase Pin-like site-specific DNA recombinase